MAITGAKKMVGFDTPRFALGGCSANLKMKFAYLSQTSSTKSMSTSVFIKPY
ncbi:hypothetical protein DFR64_2366 [Pelolinea submarina]|uniref:Uncharacterized protein n=1 Tax=Pelolinea submarina TaxID=913107 RepID=A0A3E0A8C3_9CHLR|nr:hypothetical protein DFR64_2366 [Pelolinea submarina]